MKNVAQQRLHAIMEIKMSPSIRQNLTTVRAKQYSQQMQEIFEYIFSICCLSRKKRSACYFYCGGRSFYGCATEQAAGWCWCTAPKRLTSANYLVRIFCAHAGPASAT